MISSNMNVTKHSSLGEGLGRLSVGILGAAGYTGGELIRLLVNHPKAEIVFAHSESNAGNRVADVHEGLIGDTELRFTDQMPFEKVDVIFLCFGHGKSRAFLSEHPVPEGVKIIDLAQDFRVRSEELGGRSDELGVRSEEFVYGLPELNRAAIQKAQRVANPGCFATCIQLGLLPAAQLGLLREPVVVNAITGATGAGQKPVATTHFAWRAGNISIYKAFTHQHLAEICQSLNQLQGTPVVGSGAGEVPVDFIPYRGDFARGIFATAIIRTTANADEVTEAYRSFYKDAAFTHYCESAPDLKQVVNTNKCLVHVDAFDGKILVTSVIDNLLKGAVGQAVQNMNLMFGISETTGLKLKASAF